MGGCYSCQQNNTCAYCFEELSHTKYVNCSVCNNNMHLLCVLKYDVHMKLCPFCNQTGTLIMKVNKKIETLYENNM